MHHSVEARLPFTDFRVVEHALRMPDRLRFARGLDKIALRQVAATRVPASVSGRVYKYGFPVSGGDRVAKSLHALCRNLTTNQSYRERGIYNKTFVQQLLERPPRAADTDTLFELAQMELWLSGLPQPNEKAAP